MFLTMNMWLTVVLGAAIMFALYKFFNKAKRVVGRTVLILGPMGVGKTTLFHKMCFNVDVESHTSMEPGTASICLPADADAKTQDASASKPVDLVDVPGHPSIRQQVVRKYAPSIGGIVFVMDVQQLKSSAGAQKHVRDAAEFLYDILTDPMIDRIAPPILLMFNKNDGKVAKKGNVEVDDLKKMLEKELTNLKETRAALESTGADSAEAPLLLGMANEAFDFERDSPCEMHSGCVSVKLGGNPKLVTDFVRTCMAG